MRLLKVSLVLSILFSCVGFLSAQEYQGQTFVIDCSQGGFSNDLNKDRIPPHSMVTDTRNINIHEGGRAKRGGTDNVNSTVIGGTPRIYGIYQYRQKDGSVEILTADANGELLSDYDDSSPLKTGLTIDQSVHFETFNNLCYICTGNDQVQVYDGATVSAITAPDADWTGTNFPRKMITHGRGASERLWAIGGIVDPYTISYSGLSAGDNSTEATFTSGNGQLYIDTADGFGVLNIVEFGDRLIAFGKNRVYIVDDSDSSAANWGYEKSQWEGGTATDRTVISVANDLISMTEDGTVFSVVSTESYGDYKKSTLTRAAFMDQWIRDNVKLSAIDDFHMTYDPVLRCIYIFVVRTGQTSIDTALCYFIDRGPEEGWVIKDNLNSASGYSASCSTLVRKAVGDNKIYTGGWTDGYVWEIESAAQSDNGAGYESGFRTPRFHLGDPRLTKQFDRGWLVTFSTGVSDLTVDLWVDGISVGQEVVSLASIGAVYGTGVYGTGVYGGAQLVEASFPIGKVGKRIEFFVYNNAASEDYFVAMLMVDFTPVGRFVQ